VAGRQQHHKATPGKDLPEFLRSLSNYDGAMQTRLALCLVVLTLVRTRELRAALGAEIHLETGERRIPAGRMKMRKPHIVPLSRQAVEALIELRRMGGNSAFVFPSPGAEGSMFNKTMLFAIYPMGSRFSSRRVYPSPLD